MPSGANNTSEATLLAFGSDEGNNLRLISASSRCPFRASDGTLLNVECFGPEYCGEKKRNKSTCSDNSMHKRSMENSDEWPMLLYVHGVCESAETLGVQNLAQYCSKNRWRLVVLELAGHGLSANISGYGRATCPKFDDLVQHAVDFVGHISEKFSISKGFVVCGCSLGGALVAYSVQGVLAARRNRSKTMQQNEYPDFYGVALLAPSLGVNRGAIPPTPVVTVLKALAFLIPSTGLLTPIEHPTYACPPSSERNYSGRWPLSTSSMLLDLTSRRAPTDVSSGKLSKLMEGLSSLYVIIGDKDEIIPLQDVQNWFDAVPLDSVKGKTMTVLRGAGHDFFHRIEAASKKKTAFDYLFDYLNNCAEQ